MEDGQALSVRQLAHELNNLLDGSMRSLATAQRALKEAERADVRALEWALERLQTALAGMESMAELLSRALETPPCAGEVFTQGQNVTAAVQWAVAQTRELAREHGVRVSVSVSPQAGSTPAGPLEPVLINGLRNAIEACAQSGGSVKQVELAVSTNGAGELVLLICDTGGGVPGDFTIGRSGRRDGHGVGLELSERIVAERGGRLELMNVPFGSGAVLQVHVPLQRLRGS